MQHQKPLFNYTAKEITDHASNRYQLPYEKAAFAIKKSDNFKFIYPIENRDLKEFSGFKLHINLSKATDTAKAWDMIVPILLKYSAILFQAKFVDNDTLRLEKVRLQRGKGQLFNPDKLAAINRFLTGAQITIYIPKIKNMPEADIISAYKKMTKEINLALKKNAGLAAAKTPNSDFPVTDCDFLSIRGDQDSKGNHISAISPNYNKYQKQYTDSPYIRGLVDEKLLKTSDDEKSTPRTPSPSKGSDDEFSV